MHTFNKGAPVRVLNTTFRGEVIVEGEAIIVRPVNDIDEQYLVRFSNGDTVERFVDPNAQGNDIAGYLAILNTR